MPTESDIVSDLLNRVLELSAKKNGGFDESMARIVEREIRQTYGGDEVYIPKQSPTEIEHRQKQAIADVKQGVPVREAVRKHGVSRSAIYRMIRK